jgi:phosphatidylglycerol:prolipoprotein diacylglycerol transferase
LAIAVVLSLFLADRMGIYRGFSVKLQKTLIFSIVVALVCGLAGAVLFQSVYDWIDKGTFSLNSGMTFYGGLIFGVVFFLLAWFLLGKYYGKSDEAKKQFGSVADIAACIIPLAHGLGRLGCLTAGCCHGKLTDAWYGTLQYGVTINDTYYKSATVVPVQLFEALFLLSLFGLMLYLYLRFTKPNKGGRNFPILPVYMIVYGIWRFFIEYARADERGQSIIPFLSPSQLTAVLLIAGGMLYFGLWIAYLKLRKKTGEQATKPVETIEKKVVEEDGEKGSD